MTEPTPPSVLTAGYVPLDIVVFGKRMWRAAGGTAGNVAAILSFLGWRAGVIADLGDDAAGREVVRDLRKATVDTRRIRLRPTGITPRVVHEITAGGHRFVFRCPRCGTRFPHSRPLPVDRADELVGAKAASDVFFFDRLNHGTVRLAEHFAAAGSLVVFEPARIGQQHLLDRALDAAHIVKYAADRVPDPASIPAKAGRQVHVVTRGDSGASYRIGTGTWHHSAAFPYPTVDTGGAGDWTTAGLIHALGARKRTVAAVGDALRWAQALAAVSCGAPGARGLAKQQSAEAVLRAAHFLENSRGIAPPASATTHAQRAKVADGLCDWCLLPIAADGVAPTAIAAPASPTTTRGPLAGQRG